MAAICSWVWVFLSGGAWRVLCKKRVRGGFSILRGLFLSQPEKVITQENVLKTPLNLGIPTDSPNIFNILSLVFGWPIPIAPLPLAGDRLSYVASVSSQ